MGASYLQKNLTMKKLTYLPFLAIVLVMGLASCEKERNIGCFDEDPNQQNTNTSLETPESFSAQIPAAFEAMEVLGGTETEAFYMENEGIPYFLDEEPLGVEGFEGKRPQPCRLDGERELSPDQKARLLASWKEYLICRKMAMEKIRDAHRELHQRMESRREELVKAFRAERLSEHAFKAAMEKLRHEFKAQSIKLKRQHHEVVKHCYMAFLERAQRILSPEQFKAFMHCHKRHLPVR